MCPINCQMPVSECTTSLRQMPWIVKDTFIHIPGPRLDPRKFRTWAAGDVRAWDRDTDGSGSNGEMAGSSKKMTNAPLTNLEVADSVSDPSQQQGSTSFPIQTETGGPRSKDAMQQPAHGEVAARMFLEEGDWPSGTALRLVTSGHSAGRTGSRAVQSVLLDGPHHVQARIVKDFVGQVAQLVHNPHATQVLTSIVALSDESTGDFVAKELIGMGVTLATNKHSCQLLCEILRQRWRGPFSKQLLGEVLTQGAELWHARCATDIFQETLKLGSEEQKKQVLTLLLEDSHKKRLSNVITDPKHEGEVKSIFVVAKAIVEFKDEAEPLITVLIQDATILRSLVERKYGAVLVTALLQLRGHIAEKVKQSMIDAWAIVPMARLSFVLDQIGRSCTVCRQHKSQCSSCASAATAMKGLQSRLQTGL